MCPHNSDGLGEARTWAEYSSEPCAKRIKINVAGIDSGKSQSDAER